METPKSDLREALRQRMRMARSSLGDESRCLADLQIRQKVLQNWDAAWRRVLMYVNLAEEVETLSLIRELLLQGIEVSVPCYDSLRAEYVPVRIHNLEVDLRKGKFGIMEPVLKGGDVVDVSELNALFVPGLVFDWRGNRLGFGRGYFDRLCQNAMGVKIGLAYHFQIVEECPQRSGDIPMDRLITEKGVWSCRKS